MEVKVTDQEDVIYCGVNKGSESEDNRWLDQRGKWFEVNVCECCHAELDLDGFFINNKITKNRITALEKYDWKEKVKYINHHRTVTPDTERVLNSFKSGIGTHFLVTKEGIIYQTATLNKTTSHIRNCYNANTVGIEVVGMPLD